jgi:3-methyladenine DNA glycosylase AlkD
MNDKQLKRIADALEEILRLIKKDMREIKKEAAK